MKPDPEKLRALFDEVLPSSAEHCGPSRADVLHLLRGEQQRRRRRHSGAAALAIIALALIPVLWNHQPRTVVPVAREPAEPASITVRQVNDEQLFALLRETPTALMERPNGERTLFIIEH